MKIKKLSNKQLKEFGYEISYTKEDLNIISILEADPHLEIIINSQRKDLGISKNGFPLRIINNPKKWTEELLLIAGSKIADKKDLIDTIFFAEALRIIYFLHSRYFSSIQFLLWFGYFPPSDEPPVEVFSPKEIEGYIVKDYFPEADGSIYLKINGKISKTRLKEEVAKVFDSINEKLEESLYNQNPYFYKNTLADMEFHKKIDSYLIEEKSYPAVARRLHEELGISYSDDEIRVKHDYFKKHLLPKIKSIKAY